MLASDRADNTRTEEVLSDVTVDPSISQITSRGFISIKLVLLAELGSAESAEGIPQLISPPVVYV